MNIKPSASIRQNYNAIAQLCKSTGEPVYLTKNGEGDLVVIISDTPWQDIVLMRSVIF